MTILSQYSAGGRKYALPAKTAIVTSGGVQGRNKAGCMAPHAREARAFPPSCNRHVIVT
jgi:hypothetical protein